LQVSEIVFPKTRNLQPVTYMLNSQRGYSSFF
jgi:hypothetical protein